MTKIKADGIRQVFLDQLEDLRGHTMEGGRHLDRETLETLRDLTLRLNREILLVVDDHHKVRDVRVGDAKSVPFEVEGVPGRGLSRAMIIHTHPGGSPHLSEEDLSAAVHNRLQAMIAVGVAPSPSPRFGLALPFLRDGELTYRWCVLDALEDLNQMDIAANARTVNRDARNAGAPFYEPGSDSERALLLGIAPSGYYEGIDIQDSMEELVRLVKTAGSQVAGQMLQTRPQPDPVFYFGRGKMAEAARMVQNTHANLIIANDELNSNQIAAIESATGCKTIDRTTVILDIFARHATTREGKLQVELAQQKYRLSHLKGLGLVLSRTGGGIGTRGPGEKQLETDRRHIRRQVNELLRQLAQIEKANALGAKQRTKNRIRTVGLVGYTNSGKSTLFNRLTDSEVVMKDDLFVTLDATIRKIQPEYGRYLLSDTVGFIEKLPHDLVTAFRTTLAEVKNADLLLHVVDAASPNAPQHIAVVDQVLKEIGPLEQDVILVYNKIDKVVPETADYLKNRTSRSGAFCISAKTGEGLEALMAAVGEDLMGQTKTLVYLIPYADSKALSQLHQAAEILDTAYLDGGTQVTASVNRDFPFHQFDRYLKEEASHG